MAQTETKVLTAHVPLPLADKVDLLAARMEHSRGWVVKQALSAWVGPRGGTKSSYPRGDGRRQGRPCHR